jgi:hypothetical protein
MTPKEKANKLCMRFLIQTTTDIPYGLNKAIAKECALIAVDELIESHLLLTTTHEAEPSIRCKTYWQEVKKEIEEL